MLDILLFFCWHDSCMTHDFALQHWDLLGAAALLAFLSAGLVTYVFSLTLLSRVRACELDLAELHTRLTREIKRRAGESRWQEPVDIGTNQEQPPAPALLAPSEFAKRKWASTFRGQK